MQLGPDSRPRTPRPRSPGRDSPSGATSPARRRPEVFRMSYDSGLRPPAPANRRGDDDPQRLLRALPRPGEGACPGGPPRRAGCRARAPLRAGPFHGRQFADVVRHLPSASIRGQAGPDPARRSPPGPFPAGRNPPVPLLSRERRRVQLRHLPRSPRAGLFRPRVVSGGLPVVPLRRRPRAPALQTSHPNADAGPLDASTVAGTPCPVEPRGDCVNCHMPRVEAGQHVLFADHWIRVRRPGEPVLPLRGPAPNLRLLDTPDP